MNAPPLSDCMHCGLCLEKCPTYRVTGNETKSPRGRLFLMRAIEEKRLTPADTQEHLEDCLLCRACEPTCPSGIPYGSLLNQAKASQSNLMLRGSLSLIFSSKKLLRLLAFSLRLSRKFGVAKVLETFSPNPIKVMAASIPSHPTSYYPKPGQRWQAKGELRGKVGIHLGCTNPGLFGSVLQDTIRLFQEQGFEVLTPPQPICCGALHSHSGLEEKGRLLAERTLAAFPETLDAVLVPSAGCAAHLSEHSEAPSKVFEPLLFLSRQGLKGKAKPIPIQAVWDPPCHLQHVLGSTSEVPSLLSTIPEFELLALKESGMCCGAGGISFIRSPDLSSEVTKRKLENIQASGAEFILSSNPGCQMRLEAGSRKFVKPLPVEHPISFLAKAYCASRR
ncbi:MAG: hypothetical protein CMJ96_09465 [Planctomycetes bacterium]|nr:hypothetical protein [Planctomycetota bacterium]MDP7245540.1 (Fe-S)-binding protein [Planctomycetota bacterium]